MPSIASRKASSMVCCLSAVANCFFSFWVLGFGSASAKARDSKRVADIRTIQSGLEIYNSDKGNYPATPASWTAFLTTLGASNVMPPQTGESYCYYSDSATLPTKYALVASDMEKSMPTTAVIDALTGLTLRISAKVGGSCTDQGGAVIACVDYTSGAPNDFCIKGGI